MAPAEKRLNNLSAALRSNQPETKNASPFGPVKSCRFEMGSVFDLELFCTNAIIPSVDEGTHASGRLILRISVFPLLRPGTTVFSQLGLELLKIRQAGGRRVPAAVKKVLRKARL